MSNRQIIDGKKEEGEKDGWNWDGKAGCRPAARNGNEAEVDFRKRGNHKSESPLKGSTESKEPGELILDLDS